MSTRVTTLLTYRWLPSNLLTNLAFSSAFLLCLWGTPNLYIRGIALAMTAICVLLMRDTEAPQSTHNFLIVLLLLFFANTAYFLNWETPSTILSLPDAFSDMKRYDSEKYIPTAAQLQLRGLFLLQTGLCVYMAALFANAKDFGIERVAQILKWFIIFNAVFCFVQIISFNMFGTAVVLLDTDRYLATAGRGRAFFRPTGIFNEPGTYSNIIFGILCTYYAIKKRIDTAAVLAILSLLFSFSMYGWVFAAAFSVIAVPWNARRILGATLVMLFFYILMGDVAFDYINHRFFTDDVDSYSTQAKVYAVTSWYSMPFDRQFFGNFGINDCKCLYHDSSMFFTMLTEYGALGVALLVGIGLRLLKAPRLLLLYGGLVFSKLHFGVPALGVAIYFLMRAANEMDQHGVPAETA